MQFDDVIRLRKSTRGFADDVVSREDIEKILDAAQLAPIAGADYSMTHLTVLQDPSVLSEIREVCMMHRKDGTAVDPTYNANAIIFTSVTGPSEDMIEFCNVGCAIENMLLAATDLGLGSVYLWGYLKKLRNHPEVIEKLQIPEGYTIISSLGIGVVPNGLSSREPEAKIGVNWI